MTKIFSPTPAGTHVSAPGPTNSKYRFLRWWRAPFWLLAVATGAKSFVDNPILGSRRLNRAGLHIWRLRLAHAMARTRRARLAKLLRADLREQFDRDGFIVIRDFLPAADFDALKKGLFDLDLESREHVQGDAITRRVAVGPELLNRIPLLRKLLHSDAWRGIMAYVASTRSEPLYSVQTIVGARDGVPDPQEQLHSDTFHPSLKAWLFLTDVPDDGRPLTYVAGSHHLSPARLAWERSKSIDVLSHGDRLSQRGSFRITEEELQDLGLPPPTRFSVPANTLVVADTCGFHARASSDRPTLRVELWAYCRRTPFLPWTGADLFSWRPIAIRRGEWIAAVVDWLDRRGWKKQHWRPVGRRRVCDR